MRRLPIVDIAGRAYYRDDRLSEFRAVEDPGDIISFAEVAHAGEPHAPGGA